ncbi:MAG TPA: glycosyltransferase family 2 protein [Gammaproteobacteria bacterium]|nr:glycosyltransferase family 2 protein [Gammaproteobacteria bacterium]
MTEVSIVVPLYNEQDNVARLCAATHEALLEMRRTYELVLVDDGSTDDTVAAASAIARSDARVRLVVLACNSGQTAAMAAGMAHARGRYLVTMDGDLQNDPRDIPLLVDTLEKDYDLVAGWRMKRQDKLVTRKIPSRVANWLIGKITGIPIRDNGCSLKAYRASVMRHVPLYSEMHRFIPAMSSIAGARIVQVPVRHHARQFGQSKYGLSRIYKVLLDLIAIRLVVAYANRPLVWFLKMAVGPAVLAAAFTAGGIVRALGGEYSLPLFGSGLILALAVGFLLALGSLGELAKHCARGDVVPLVTASAKYSKPIPATNSKDQP